MNELETKLENILKKIKKPGISLQEANDLYFKAKKLGLQAKKEELTKKVFKLAASGICWTYQVGRNYFVEWISGEAEPTDHELDLLDKMADELLDIIPKFSQDEIEPWVLTCYRNFDDFVSDITLNLRQAKNLVKIEKSRRRKKTSNQKTTEKSEKDSTIKELQQQISILVKLMASLENQIQGLEEKLSQQKSPQLQEQLTALKQQQQQVQSQLRQKNEQIDKVDKKNNQSAPNQSQTQPKEIEPTQNKFNWWWVVIPMGGAIILLLGIVIFQFWKKKPSQ